MRLARNILPALPATDRPKLQLRVVPCIFTHGAWHAMVVGVGWLRALLPAWPESMQITRINHH